MLGVRFHILAIGLFLLFRTLWIWLHNHFLWLSPRLTPAILSYKRWMDGWNPFISTMQLYSDYQNTVTLILHSKHETPDNDFFTPVSLWHMARTFLLQCEALWLQASAKTLNRSWMWLLMEALQKWLFSGGAWRRFDLRYWNTICLLTRPSIPLIDIVWK